MSLADIFNAVIHANLLLWLGIPAAVVAVIMGIGKIIDIEQGYRS